MAYIGQSPSIGNFQVCDAISTVNGQATYNLTVSSVAVTPETAFHVLCSVNGVLQKSGSAFTTSGSTIVFSSNLVTNDVVDFVHILGSVLDLGVPSDDTVTAAKINNNAISGKTALATEPADTDEFLVSDAGVLKRIDYSLIKGGSSHKTLLLTVTLSNVANITVNNTYITSAYRDYYFTLSNVHAASDNVDFPLRVSTDNGSSFITGSDYNRSAYGRDSEDTLNKSASDAGTDMNLMSSPTGNATSENFNSEGYIFDPLGTNNFTTFTGRSVYSKTDTRLNTALWSGHYEAVTAVNCFKLNFGSGNIASGVFKFYGIT